MPTLIDKDHVEISESKLSKSVEMMLEILGTDWPTLRRQGELGRFPTDLHRRIWFIISSLVND